MSVRSKPSTGAQRAGSKISDTCGRRHVGEDRRMTVAADDLLVWSIPMRTRFRGIDVREGVLLRGDAGLGGVLAVLGLRRRASACRGCAAAREAADDGWPAPRPRRRCRSTSPCRRSGRAGRGDSCAASAGCRTAKVKVAEPGQAEADDLARVEAVRDALGPAAGSGSTPTAAGTSTPPSGWSRLLDRVRAGVRRAAVPHRRGARRRTPARSTCPVAADESIRRADDPLRVARLEAADIAVLKVQPLGGVRACLRIAEQIGLPVVVSSALETSVGIAAGAGAGRRAARAAVRLRARHPAAARRRRHVRARSRVVDGALPVVAPRAGPGEHRRRRRNHGAPMARKAAGCAHRPPNRGAPE